MQKKLVYDMIKSIKSFGRLKYERNNGIFVMVWNEQYDSAACIIICSLIKRTSDRMQNEMKENKLIRWCTNFEFRNSELNR